MSIDIGSILENGLGAATKVVVKGVPELGDYLRKIAKGHEAAIQSLADAFAIGDIDEETFKDEMDDEGKTLVAELQAIAAISKAIAQRAINAFSKTVFNGITTAVKAVI